MRPKLSRVDVIIRYLNFLDPIGGVYDAIEAGGVPNDYDSYGPKILKLLESGTDAEKLYTELKRIQSEDMGVPHLFDEIKTRMVANGLIEFFSQENY